MPATRATIHPDIATHTQRVIDALGGPTPITRLIERTLGYRISRQAINVWYAQGHLPFMTHAPYAKLLVREAKRVGLTPRVTLGDLLAEVPVPHDRLPV